MTDRNPDAQVDGAAPKTEPNATAKAEVKARQPMNNGQIVAGLGAFVLVALLGISFGYAIATKAPTQANLQAPPAANQQVAAAPTAPASDSLASRPWFEVGGRMPNTEIQAQAKAQGYAVEKGKSTDAACFLAEGPNGTKVRRCPNSWVKR